MPHILRDLGVGHSRIELRDIEPRLDTQAMRRSGHGVTPVDLEPSPPFACTYPVRDVGGREVALPHLLLEGLPRGDGTRLLLPGGLEL